MTVLLAEKCTVWQAKEIMLAAPKRYSHFPGLSDIEDLIREFRILQVWRPEPEWISERCPGIPASIEALCLGIEEGRTGDRGWVWGFEALGFPMNQLWDIYESWLEGKIHASIQNYNGFDRDVVLRVKRKMREEAQARRPKMPPAAEQANLFG